MQDEQTWTNLRIVFFFHTECLCTTNGTKHRNCHKISGQCSCKIGLTGKNCTICATGYTGDNCDSCAPGFDHYGYPDCRKLGHKGKSINIHLHKWKITLVMTGSKTRAGEFTVHNQSECENWNLEYIHGWC